MAQYGRWVPLQLGVRAVNLIVQGRCCALLTIQLCPFLCFDSHCILSLYLGAMVIISCLGNVQNYLKVESIESLT